MAQVNKTKKPRVVVTNEGGRGVPMPAIEELRRTVSACLLWEDGFYEGGEDVASRMERLVWLCTAREVEELIVDARERLKLRHAPLWLCVCLAKMGRLKADTLAATVRRADEPGEFLALFWKDGRKMLPRQIKRGLAMALRRFDEYEVRKYGRRKCKVSLRDVLRMVRPKPWNREQEILWGAVVAGELAPAGTWENRLSDGQDKREVFEDLLTKGKLGDLALLRNLRKMTEAKVDEGLIRAGLLQMSGRKVLPFRYVAAARACPKFEPELDGAMQRSLEGMEKLPGRTAIVLDHSASMDWAVSRKSDLKRSDAAAALGAILMGVCEEPVPFAFSDYVAGLPPRQGMAFIDAYRHAGVWSGTLLWLAVESIAEDLGPFDRMVVVTDEQTADSPMRKGPLPIDRCYMINIGTDRHGVGHGPTWTTISGFSEGVIRYIQEVERVPCEAVPGSF